jgi:hypothetical protein
MKGTQTIVVVMVLGSYDHEKNVNNSSSDCTKQPHLTTITMKKVTLIGLNDHDHEGNMSNNINGAKQPRAQRKHQ